MVVGTRHYHGLPVMATTAMASTMGWLCWTPLPSVVRFSSWPFVFQLFEPLPNAICSDKSLFSQPFEFLSYHSTIIFNHYRLGLDQIRVGERKRLGGKDSIRIPCQVCIYRFKHVLIEHFSFLLFSFLILEFILCNLDLICCFDHGCMQFLVNFSPLR